MKIKGLIKNSVYNINHCSEELADKANQLMLYSKGLFLHVP